jgi:hypothetical protein
MKHITEAGDPREERSRGNLKGHPRAARTPMKQKEQTKIKSLYRDQETSLVISKQ